MSRWGLTMRAYDSGYLLLAQRVLGRSFDYAVVDLGIPLRSYFDCFLATRYADRFCNGDFRVLAGMSGVELARLVLQEAGCGRQEFPRPNSDAGRGPEYWAGWALAYYQWNTGFSFAEIAEFMPIEQVLSLYRPYHEMDVSHFVLRLNELREERVPDTELKRRRLALGLSQRDLAERSGVSARSIQQYEQRRKDINKASFYTVAALADALHCKNPIVLFEHL